VAELGNEIICRLIQIVMPALIVNIEMADKAVFNVPGILQQRTITLRRKPIESNSGGGSLSGAVLRTFLVAGYLSQCFSLYSSPYCGVELRLANVLSFRVRFSTISVYIHPELPHVADKLILSALNCAVVALCVVENEFEDNFTISRVLDSDSLPSRIELDHNGGGSSKLPMLRCYGFGMIRAIDTEKKLFYVITPVETDLLANVKVFALGHELQAPPILFDSKSYEPAPYMMELGKTVSRDHQKLYSPLRVITGSRRALSFQRNHSSNQIIGIKQQTKQVKHVKRLL